LRRLGELAKSDLIRHGILVFAATMLVNVLGYAYHFAISRHIGVVQYGVLSALNAAIMISTVIGVVLTTVVVKYAAEFRALDDRAHLAALARQVGIYGTLGGIAVMLGGMALAVPIAAFLNISNVAAVALTMVIVGFSVTNPGLRAIFQGTEDFNRYSISIVMESTLKAALGIGLVFAGFGVVGAFGGWAAGSLTAFAYNLFTIRRRFARVEGVPVRFDVTRLVRTTANVALATLMLTVISYADVLLVKHFADPTTAGLYGALSLSGKILLFLVGFVPTVLLPKATRKAMRGHSPAGVFLQALGLSVAMSGAGLVFYYFFPALVVTRLAGAAFAPAASYVFGYGFAMVLLAGLNLVVTYKIGLHRFDFIVPLAVCTVGEIVGISVYHASLADVIAVLIAGNGLALAGSAYKVTSPLVARPAAPAAASDAA
jgi:O-antigen/teichoic acid export membrane protein